jgi:glycosyltransferase involved in cell wall biosynthesis
MMILSKPFLSLVIPVYNEAGRLSQAIQKVDAFVHQQDYEIEVLIVENGSTDDTLSIAQSFAQSRPYLRIFRETQRGKGLAVKRGMLEARGEYRVMCDVDFSMPIEQVSRFIPPYLNEVEVAIGSREVPGARRFEEPVYRHMIGRIFNTMVRWLVLPGLHDTQCGFKCFRGDVAEVLFPLQTLEGMSFDTEVLFIAREKGLTIKEVPIDWYFDPDSRVRLIQDSLKMAVDLVTIRRNAQKGLYDGQA